jgi:hypothetical protein
VLFKRSNGRQIGLKDDAAHGFSNLLCLALDTMRNNRLRVWEHPSGEIHIVLRFEGLTGGEVGTADKTNAAAFFTNSACST